MFPLALFLGPRAVHGPGPSQNGVAARGGLSPARFFLPACLARGAEPVAGRDLFQAAAEGVSALIAGFVRATRIIRWYLGVEGGGVRRLERTPGGMAEYTVSEVERRCALHACQVGLVVEKGVPPPDKVDTPWGGWKKKVPTRLQARKFTGSASLSQS